MSAWNGDTGYTMDRISREITQRVKELGECYETPLPLMLDRVTELEAKVNHQGMDCFDHIGISHTERDNGKERTAKLVRIRVRLHRAAQLGLVEQHGAARG